MMQTQANPACVHVSLRIMTCLFKKLFWTIIKRAQQSAVHVCWLKWSSVLLFLQLQVQQQIMSSAQAVL